MKINGRIFQQSSLAHMAVFSANILFAVNFSVVKHVTPSLIRPFGLNVARVLVTTALFWLLLLFKKPKQRILWSDMPLFGLCALTGVAINQLLFIKGLSMTYSTHAALLMLSTPIMITIVAYQFLGEALTLKRVIGLLLGIGGAALLIMGGQRTGSGTDIVWGNILVLLNAISYSFYFVLVKPLMKKYSPLQVIRWVFTLGALIVVPVGWREFASAPWSGFSHADLAAIGFVVIGATFLAYLLNIFGLQHLNASSTGSYIYMQPVIAACIAAYFLDEPFTVIKAISAAFIFTGVYLVIGRKD
jgi:drug/metabolite transporter (DMT)-like permease